MLLRWQKNMMSVADNNVSTLGLGLDLESRYQEAEKVCCTLRSLHYVLLNLTIQHVSRYCNMINMSRPGNAVQENL